MKIKERLEKILMEKAPGPAPSFSIFHLLRALELIAEKSFGRLKLSEKLKLGEGATRTLLGRLKEAQIITTSRTGCKLTEKGRKLWKQYRSVFKRKVCLENNELTLAKHNVALLVKNHKDMVKTGMEQRDAAILYGARGAVTLIYTNGKLVIPGVSEDVAEAFPEAHEQIIRLLVPEESDVIIIGYADSQEKAEYGALAAAWTLLNDC
jgi:predicted transcriptional regulator